MLTQYGVCCFRYDDEGRLEARPFNSFILPSTKFGMDRVYSCQQSSMAFLRCWGLHSSSSSESSSLLICTWYQVQLSCTFSGLLLGVVLALGRGDSSGGVGVGVGVGVVLVLMLLVGVFVVVAVGVVRFVLVAHGRRGVSSLCHVHATMRVEWHRQREVIGTS